MYIELAGSFEDSRPRILHRPRGLREILQGRVVCCPRTIGSSPIGRRGTGREADAFPSQGFAGGQDEGPGRAYCLGGLRGRRCYTRLRGHYLIPAFWKARRDQDDRLPHRSRRNE